MSVVGPLMSPKVAAPVALVLDGICFVWTTAVAGFDLGVRIVAWARFLADEF